MAVKIAISGSRKYTRWGLVHDTIAAEYRKYDGLVLFLIGDCPTGVDAIAKAFFDLETQWPYKEFYADWDRYGRAAGPIRNHEMIDYGADKLIAFPDNESKGTWECANYAKSLNIPVFFPELEPWMVKAAPIACIRE